MAAHVLGWFTLVWILATTVGTAQWFRVASRDSRSWRRPLPTPKPSAAPLVMTSGSDYVGYI